MNTEFDLKKFLTENKLTKVSRALSEASKKKIKVLKDLYYFDKLGGVSAKDAVSEKYHEGGELLFKKGKTIQDDSEYDDSEYKMIVGSRRLKEGEDYKILSEVSRALNENILDKELSGRYNNLTLRDALIDLVELWPVSDLEQTTDHFGEIAIEYLEDAGETIPQGMFNSKMDEKLIGVREMYDSLSEKGDQSNLDAVAEKFISVIKDPENYE